jgi:hypothetical protein
MRQNYPNCEWTNADLCRHCAPADLKDFDIWLQEAFFNNGCPMCYLILDCADLQGNSGQIFVNQGSSTLGNDSLYALRASYYPPSDNPSRQACVSTLAGTLFRASILRLRRISPSSIHYTLIKEWIT